MLSHIAQSNLLQTLHRKWWTFTQLYPSPLDGWIRAEVMMKWVWSECDQVVYLQSIWGERDHIFLYLVATMSYPHASLVHHWSINAWGQLPRVWCKGFRSLAIQGSTRQSYEQGHHFTLALTLLIVSSVFSLSLFAKVVCLRKVGVLAAKHSSFIQTVWNPLLF